MSEPRVLQNGRIWTADPGHPWASSLTIHAGRVSAVDTSALPGASVRDLEGAFAVPGLVDTHLHLLMGGLALGDLDLSGVTSRTEFEAAIERRHHQLPADRWLIGHGWSQDRFDEPTLPDKTWLHAAGDRPVVCHRMDVHTALVNDAVLEMFDTTGDPPGGRIQRDASGDPTGILFEAASWKLLGPLVPAPDAETRRRALADAEGHLLGFGVTTVGTMEYFRDVHEVYEPLRDRRSVRSLVTLLDRAWPLDLSDATGFANDDHLAIIGAKAFIDGTLGSRTARMLADYDDDPGNCGLFVELAADGHLEAWARLVADTGLSPSMHAIGDAAARMALQVLETDTETFRRVRARVEHAQQIDPDDIDRFNGVIASMQPLHKAEDAAIVERRLGLARTRGTFPFRSLREAGAILAFGSDFPVVSCDPLAGVRVAVTGVTTHGTVFKPDENIPVEAALEACTRDAGWALGRDDVGVLRPGSVGDVVLLDRDPFTAEWINAPPRVIETFVGGVSCGAC